MSGIPLIIGCSGHIDIGDKTVDQVKKVVREQILIIKATYEHTNLMMMNGLADGFDAISYELAKELSIPFIGLLPMPLADYKLKHDAPDKLEEMIAYAGSQIIEVQEFIKYSGDKFDLKYKGLGQFLAVYSDILITYWQDEENTGYVGGTEEVVNIRKGKVVRLPHKNDSTNQEGEFKRQSNEQLLNQAFKRYGARGPLLVINSKSLKTEWQIEMGINKYLESLNKENKKMNVENNSLQAYRNHFKMQAAKMKEGHGKRLKWLFTCAFLAVAAFEGYGYFPGKNGVYAFLGLTALFIVFYNIYKRTGYHQRAVDNRLLSEIMRVAIHWESVGMTYNVNRIISYKNHELIQDILEVYYSIYLLSYLDKQVNSKPLATSTGDGSAWFKGQYRYFKNNYKGHKKHITFTRIIEVGLIILYGLLAISVILIKDLAYVDICLWLTGAIAALSGLVIAYRQMTVFDELVDGYRYMYDVHETALSLCANADFTDVERLFEYVGSIALEENIDWYRMNSSKTGNFTIL